MQPDFISKPTVRERADAKRAAKGGSRLNDEVKIHADLSLLPVSRRGTSLSRYLFEVRLLMPVSGFLLMYRHPAMTASGFLKSKTPGVGVVESYTRKSIYSIIHLLWSGEGVVAL